MAWARQSEKHGRTQHIITSYRQAPTLNTDVKEVKVVVQLILKMSPNNIQIIPFCAHLPSQSPGEYFGVVGTITLRGQSAVVWLGWGDIEACEDESEQQSEERNVDKVVRIGSGEYLLSFISIRDKSTTPMKS